MASFNFTVKQMTAKIVYYGPGLCGKTTNLHYIHDHTAGDARGEMVSLETDTDRTLFLPIGGSQTRGVVRPTGLPIGGVAIWDGSEGGFKAISFAGDRHADRFEGRQMAYSDRSADR